MKKIRAKIDNPISELISDKEFDLLYSEGLINFKAIRDHQMRKKYRQLRAAKIRAFDAIFEIQDEYRYLQYDTIRKIVYGYSMVLK